MKPRFEMGLMLLGISNNQNSDEPQVQMGLK